MEAGQTQPLAHVHPGTSVSNLFPLGNSVLEVAFRALHAQLGQENSVATGSDCLAISEEIPDRATSEPLQVHP